MDPLSPANGQTVGRFSGQSRQRTDAIGLESVSQLTVCLKPKSVCGKQAVVLGCRE